MKLKIYPKACADKRVMLAMSFIESNFAEKISLNDIALEACLSKYHLIRMFKEVNGMTPHQYLTLVRVQRAKQLLHKDRSVSEVCAMVGFESISSFSLLFKKQAGVSPSIYLDSRRPGVH